MTDVHRTADRGNDSAVPRDRTPTRRDSKPPITLEVFASGAIGETSFQFAPGVDRCVIGSGKDCDLVVATGLADAQHCEITLGNGAVKIRDLGTRTGTYVDGVRVDAAWLVQASSVQVGEAQIRLRITPEPIAPTLSSHESFEELVGKSIPMRRVFALLERCAVNELTVLLEGETGTGKEATAQSIHARSGRKKGPFVVVDCSAIPPNLIESELFGHEKGSFTGAHVLRIGAFEEASGGTIFLDEIGEVPLDVQPKLLRALERKTVRRVGSNNQIPVDIRILAATNRSLREEVQKGRFRSDLYFRLNVVKVELPPLRQRLDDLPMLIERLLETLRADDAGRQRVLHPDFIRRLRSYDWPGNVRELRNAVERALVLDDVPLGDNALNSDIPDSRVREEEGPWCPPTNIPYADARTLALEKFEATWLESLLALHDGNVTRAADAAQLARPYLHRLLKRHGIRGTQG